MSEFKVLSLVKQNAIVKKFVKITLSILGIFVLMLFLPWQQTAKGIGTLTALDPVQRDYKISSTVHGFIEKFYVKENQKVKKGDKLFRMRDLDENYENRLISIREKSISNYENKISLITNLKENLAHQKNIFQTGIEIYDKKIIQLKNSLSALENQKIALKNKNKIELINYKRAQSLFKDGIESKRDLELKEGSYLHANASYKKASADLENTIHDFEIAKKEKSKFTDETNLKMNTMKNTILATENIANALKQDIEKESTSLSRYLSGDVVAKSDGYVIRIYQNDTNKLIKKGENVLYFSPIVTQRAIMLKISDLNMPLIKEGLQSRILFYGWPAMQISGWPKITHGTYGGTIKSIERTSYEKGVYYAVITEDINESNWPDAQHLKIGTQATIWVRLATVSIGYEIWRLMLSQPPNMVTPPVSR